MNSPKPERRAANYSIAYTGDLGLWTYPDLVDTPLAGAYCCSNVAGLALAQGRVAALAMIPHLDLFEDGLPRRGPRREHPGGPRRLQCREAALQHRVVIAIAGAAHAHLQLLRRQPGLIRLRRLVASPIRRVQHPGRWPSLRRGHLEGRRNELLLQVRRHRPTHPGARVEIEHRRPVQPPCVGRNVRNVSHPLLVRPRRRELAVKCIRGNRMAMRRVSRCHCSPPLPSCMEACLTHQARHSVAATADAGVGQLRMDPRGTIGAAATLKGPNPTLLH